MMVSERFLNSGDLKFLYLLNKGNDSAEGSLPKVFNNAIVLIVACVSRTNKK